jgi:hypothetical protein
MKKTIYFLVFLVGIVLTLSACEFETSGNGDLDGLWQLAQQDSVATEASQDMRQSGIYWAVQVRLLEIQGGPQSGYYRFRRADGRLKLYSPNLDKEGREDTTSLYDYRVLKLNGSRMVLEDEKVRLTFRKY